MSKARRALKHARTQVKGIAQVDYVSVSYNAHCFEYKEEGHLGLRLGDNRTVTRTADISDPPADPPLLVRSHETGTAKRCKGTLMPSNPLSCRGLALAPHARHT